ncbi:hypothetical protein EON63_12815 [archaeon]|nr:MAG: hypothetical protein EON63_12815 [archaeon]
MDLGIGMGVGTNNACVSVIPMVIMLVYCGYLGKGLRTHTAINTHDLIIPYPCPFRCDVPQTTWWLNTMQARRRHLRYTRERE